MQQPQGARRVSRTAAEQRAHLARELVETLLFVAVVFFIIHVTIQTFRISDAAMSPQLLPDQLVLVNTQAFLFGGPGRGDVVVVDNPHSLAQQVVRRVVAVPGDTVQLTATQVIVNGVTLKEPYITVPAGEAQNNTVVPSLKLGPGQYFVLEDNRTLAGDDSRTFGVVPRGNIVGKAVLVFWPLSSLHFVANDSNVFNGIPSR